MKKQLIYFLLVFFSSTSCVWGQTAEEWYQKGLKKYESEQYLEASKDFLQATQFKEDYLDAYRMLWKSRMEARKYISAMYAIRKALEIDSTLAEAYLDRSYLLYNIYMTPEKALVQLDTALLLKPDYGDAYFQKGMILFTLDKRKEACQLWKKAQELENEKADLFLELYCK